MIDWSGSPVRTALEECWSNVRRELPGLIEVRRVDHLTLWSFDEDGWCPKRLKEIPLPVFNPPGRREQSAGEWDSFANIRDALRESEEGQWRTRRKAAEDQYGQAVVEALKPLDSARALPERDYETKQSDIVGLLKRISQSKEQSPRLFIVLTDLADTRHRELPRIPAPEGEVRVVLLLLPAQPKDALLTIGKALSGPEQFELRARQLREAAPWVGTAPYFSDNFVAALSMKPKGGIPTSP